MARIDFFYEESERGLLLNRFPVRGLRERRWMSFLQVQAEGQEAPRLCLANLHASTGRRGAEKDVRRAARSASAWANGLPLVLGGDFNVRPRSSTVFDELQRDFGLTAPTNPAAIDHLLARGLRVTRPPSEWPPDRRDVKVIRDGGTRRIRLSDHAPVEGTFEIP